MEINCWYNYQYYGSMRVYKCTIREANITEKDQIIQKFKGIHKRRRRVRDIKTVSFFNTIVDHFPRGIQLHFRNVTNLFISKCDLKEISKNDLKGLEKVYRFVINFCKLTTLPDDLLTEMPKLKVVSFSDNKIEFASSELLKPLLGRKNVKVGLRGNKSIDAQFWPGSEDSQDSLDELMKLIDEKCINPAFAPDLVDFDPKLKEIWLSGKFSDLTIFAGENNFKAHKAVLVMKNEVFAKLLEEQSEATEIKIPGFSATSVRVLLKFIYTNEASENGDAKENFEIAEKFKVEAMKSIYGEIVRREIGISEGLEVFLSTHRFASYYETKRAARRIMKELQTDLPNKLIYQKKISEGVWAGIIAVMVSILIIIGFLKQLIV